MPSFKTAGFLLQNFPSKTRKPISPPLPNSLSLPASISEIKILLFFFNAIKAFFFTSKSLSVPPGGTLVIFILVILSPSASKYLKSLL